MTNQNLEKAREWADRTLNNYPFPSHEGVAARLIQSLPDQWVDVEKVRDLIDLYKHARDANAPGNEAWIINDLVIGNLERLLSPKLPTLADMTQEERKACQWMQAQVFPTASTLGIITCIDEYERSATILFTDGMAKNVPWEDIAPLTGEPKLKWPGNEVVETPALPEGMRLADHEEYGRVVVAPRANTHGEEFFYRMGEDSLWGASYGYRPTEEFTFLDGDQHV